MKLLYITVRADIGGGPIHMNELIEKCNFDYSEIYLACPSEGKLYKKWKSNENISEIFELPFRGFSINSLLGLRRFVIDNGISIIHSHGKGAGVYSRLLKLIHHRVKVIHTFHGIGNVSNPSLFSKIRNVYIERVLKNLTHKYISVSKGEKQLAVDNFKIRENKIDVIHNGVSRCNYTTDGNAICSIVTIARFSPEKNMKAALVIAKALKANNKFVWIGDGEQFKEIEKQIVLNRIDNIELLGFQNKPREYLKHGNIYLSTSKHEGLPLALLEAESCGIPIVATNVVGNNEVVKNGYNGFLFEQGDVKTALKKIELLINDKELYKTMSKNALRDYENRFTVEKMVKETEKIYDSIIIK